MDKTRFMIRATASPSEDVTELIEVLERAGISIDRQYPAVPLDKDGSKILLRGRADPTDAERICEELQVELFPEIQIKNT